MAQRPHSEGHTVPDRATTRRALGRQQHAALSHSYDSFTDSVLVSSDSSDDGQESDDRTIRIARGLPRRPRTTPKKGRIQRFILGPGHGHVQESLTSKREVFMTHLPDSPPRLYESDAPEPRQPRQEPTTKGSIFSFPVDRAEGHVGDGSDEELEDSSEESASSPVTGASTNEDLPAFTNEDEEVDGERQEEPADEDEVVEVQTDRATVQSDDVDELSSEDDDPSTPGPEMNESTEWADEVATVAGPHAVDISGSPELLDDANPERTTSPAIPAADDMDEQAYQELQMMRRRLEDEEQRREQVRQDLASYVQSLTVRQDEDGAKWIEFPKNYQQILSLMTERDVRDEDEETKTSSRVPTAKGSDRQKSWSQILIQNSLSKQQAYGALDESEDGPDGETSLAAKIALKMARVRQLDAVLEEKLGKNLYATTTTTIKKTKPKKSTTDDDGSTARKQHTKDTTPSTQRSSVPKESTPATSAMNFIERNRKVVENGAKANLTRDEEDRLTRLLRDTESDSTTPENGMTELNQFPHEFTLDDKEKFAIEQILAEKRGLYASALLPPLDDIDEESSATDEAPTSVKKHASRKPNIVQETKKERLRRQRLMQIDEELEFLRENETVPILPDEDDDPSDGCMTERSYMTTTSMTSTCSTRSGVTRRQLSQFVASELSKAAYSGEKASTDEIQSLLRSLSHVSISRPTTTV